MNEEEDARVILTTREARETALVELKGLLDSPVWKLMLGKLNGTRASIIHQMESCSNPNELLRYAGMLKAYVEIKHWPEAMVQALTKQFEKEKR